SSSTYHNADITPILHDALPISPLLQRECARAEHAGRDVPHLDHREHVRLHSRRILRDRGPERPPGAHGAVLAARPSWTQRSGGRSEEHTSELQSREKLVCRLLL